MTDVNHIIRISLMDIIVSLFCKINILFVKKNIKQTLVPVNEIWKMGKQLKCMSQNGINICFVLKPTYENVLIHLITLSIIVPEYFRLLITKKKQIQPKTELQIVEN